MSLPGKTGNPTVLFYVQHLLGIGHVFRATRVARALVGAGFKVYMVWGGTRLPSINLDGLDMIWLEPVKAGDAHIVDLVRTDGSPVDEALLSRRRETLLSHLADLRPDIVITETYPFGRRQMRFELEPFMAAARGAPWKPITISSIRDIMTENRKPVRVNETLEAVREWYDLVLVHGDARLITLADTLPGAKSIEDKIRYTGLVTPEPVNLEVRPSITCDVIVSAGGGAVGHALTAAAIGAHDHCKTYPENWLLVVGSERSSEDYKKLKARANDRMRVVRYVPDLTRVLASAKVSVSRAGYNTVGDLMRANCRSVLAPFSGGRETEQLRRAKLLAECGLCAFVADDELSPEALGAFVDKAATYPRMKADFDIEGADNSAKIVFNAYHSR
ncbi:MAG: glycosyltransferase family protein [Rhizobiaceae bacterium]